MLNNCELKILGLLLRTPTEFFSINNLDVNIKLAYPYVYNSVSKLEKKRLLTVKKIGKSNLCQVQFDNPSELALAAMESSRQFLTSHHSINNIITQLKAELSDELYILLLFGSYAKGTATLKSDIDLFFIINDENNIELFRKKVKVVLNKLHYPVEFDLSTMEWFYEMLNDKTTVGREIFKTNFILHNAEAYLYLIRKYDQRQRY